MRPHSELPQVPSASALDASNPWVNRQLADLRDRTLKWTPRDTPVQRLTFVDNRLFALTNTEVVVVDAAGKADLQRFGLEGPHQLTALADGSVLGVGTKSTFRIRPLAKNPDVLNKVMLLPENQVFGSASDASRFDVFDATLGQWESFSFEAKPTVSSLWLPDISDDLPEMKHAHCAQLIDGGYGCYATGQLWRFYSRGKPKSFGTCGVGLPVWRVLGGPRADQLWIARDDGRLEKWWFGPPPKRLAVLQLPWTPLDVAVQKDHLAVIRIIQERAKPKQLTLVVLDVEGKTRFEQSLHPNFDDETSPIEQELREAEVAVHPRRPWVAVRTTRGVRLLNGLTGETITEVR